MKYTGQEVLKASNLGFENMNLNPQTTLRSHKGLAQPPSTFPNVLFYFFPFLKVKVYSATIWGGIKEKTEG